MRLEELAEYKRKSLAKKRSEPERIRKLRILAEEHMAEAVDAAERGEDQLREALHRVPPRLRGLVLLGVPCRAAWLAAHRPHRALALVAGLRNLATTDDWGGSEPRIDTVLGEIRLLESQALLWLQKPETAAKAAREARNLLGDGPIDIPRADYFEGSALGFMGRYDEAQALLLKALSAFEKVGDDYWIGRACGALGTLLCRAGSLSAAASLLTRAIDTLGDDDHAVAVLELNRGAVHALSAEPKEARTSYFRALELSVRHRLGGVTILARINLADLFLTSFDFGNGLAAFERVRGQALAAGQQNLADYCLVVAAQCLRGLGRAVEARDLLRQASGDYRMHITELGLEELESVRKNLDVWERAA